MVNLIRARRTNLQMTPDERRKAATRLSRIRAKAGRIGGKATSEKKIQAALANLKKANETNPTKQ